MNADPRAALEALTLAFERHLEACSARRGDDDPAVIAASDALADAFETYDDALLNAFNEMTPLVLLDDAGPLLLPLQHRRHEPERRVDRGHALPAG